MRKQSDSFNNIGLFILELRISYRLRIYILCLTTRVMQPKKNFPTKHYQSDAFGFFPRI
jgi:hypothetical protein